MPVRSISVPVLRLRPGGLYARFIFNVVVVIVVASLVDAKFTYPVLAPFLLPFFTLGSLLPVLFYLYIILAILIFNALVKCGLIK